MPCGGGLVNLRVGAIILKGGKLLMAGNRLHPEYLFSVGGRIKFGETAEEILPGQSESFPANSSGLLAELMMTAPFSFSPAATATLSIRVSSTTAT